MTGDPAEPRNEQLDAFVEMLRHLREPLLIASPSGDDPRDERGGRRRAGDERRRARGGVAGRLRARSRPSAGAAERTRTRTFPLRFAARDGRRFVCDASALAPGVVLLRLSGGPDAALRARSFDSAHRLGIDPPARDREGASRLERLHAFTRTLARAITLPDVIEAVVDMGLAATAARGGGLWLLSDDGSTVSLVRAVGVGGPRPEHYADVPIDSADADADPRRDPERHPRVDRVVRRDGAAVPRGVPRLLSGRRDGAGVPPALRAGSLHRRLHVQLRRRAPVRRRGAGVLAGPRLAFRAGHRAGAALRGRARRRPAEGRVSRDPQPRAPKPAGPDRHRARCHEAPRRRGLRERARRPRAPRPAHRAAGRRPARHRGTGARQDPAPEGDRRGLAAHLEGGRDGEAHSSPSGASA